MAHIFFVDREVRDILFHPTRKLLLTSGDDSVVRIYEQTKTIEPPPSTTELLPLREKENREKDQIYEAYEFSDEENLDTEAEEEEEEEDIRRHKRRLPDEEVNLIVA